MGLISIYTNANDRTKFEKKVNIIYGYPGEPDTDVTIPESTYSRSSKDIMDLFSTNPLKSVLSSYSWGHRLAKPTDPEVQRKLNTLKRAPAYTWDTGLDIRTDDERDDLFRGGGKRRNKKEPY